MRRRTFLQALGSGAITAAAARAAQSVSCSGAVTLEIPQLINGQIEVTGSVVLPCPADSGIDHIVVVTMENRSFDHFLGWLKGANGHQAGLSYPDTSGTVHSTYALAPSSNPQYTGCPHPDPDHSYSGSRIAYANGAMNGFLKNPSNDMFCIGYYEAAAQPYFSALAQNYLVCDSWFASILGPTFPNRLFLWTGQTDRLGDGINLTSLPTIFDRLHAANVSHRYYFNNVPFTALWGLKYLTATSLFAQFQAEASRGTLPSVCFIDPRYTVLDDGTGNDDHPHADIRNGEQFLSQVVSAIYNSPQRDRTVLIIMFDEWGGFFEHVAPPRVVPPVSKNYIDTDQANGEVLLGFRIPPIIISPFTRNTSANPLISSALFDHTSVLKLIEWRWNLQPLALRDAPSSQIANLAIALNFQSPNYSIPATLPAAPGVVAPPCFGGGIFSANAQTPVAALPSESVWANLGNTQSVRQFLSHPQFQ
jgi:phospholipase C